MHIARTVAALGAALAAAVPAGAGAIETRLYDFSISRPDGTPIFSDAFNDGVPPVFVSGQPNAYFVMGTYPAGSEVPPSASMPDGYLTLNSMYGQPGFSPSGVPNTLQRARHLSDTSPTDALGLKRANAFVVNARFDLANPGGVDSDNGYGIALTDPVLAPGGTTIRTFNTVSLNVGGGLNGPVLRLFYVDNGNLLGNGAGFYVLGETPVTPGGQIELRLSKTTGGTAGDNDLVHAFYRLGGSGAFTELLDTSNAADARLFHQLDWTQAEFRIFAPVPEPSAYLTLAAGLTILGTVMLRRSRG